MPVKCNECGTYYRKEPQECTVCGQEVFIATKSIEDGTENDPLMHVSVRIPRSMALTLKKIGDGYYAKGVRYLVREYKNFGK